MDENQRLTKTLGSLKKIADFIKILKFETLKCLKNQFIVTKNYAVP